MLSLENKFKNFRVRDQKPLNFRSVINKDLFSKDLCSYAESGKKNNVLNQLKNGADIHYNKDYALRMASLYGHLEVVKTLLDYNSKNYNKQFDFEFALLWSSRNGYLDIVIALIKAGAKLTMLSKAIIRDFGTFEKRETILFLISKKVLINTDLYFLLRYVNFHLQEDYNKKNHSTELLLKCKQLLFDKIGHKLIKEIEIDDLDIDLNKMDIDPSEDESDYMFQDLF